MPHSLNYLLLHSIQNKKRKLPSPNCFEEEVRTVLRVLRRFLERLLPKPIFLLAQGIKKTYNVNIYNAQA